MPKVLVTGGAGYIGSHVVKMLAKRGYDVVVLDNLSKGFAEAVTAGELVVGDTGDQALVAQLIDEHDIRAVMHFAALTVVPESVADPLLYYRNNTANTRNLIECCVAGGVERFIFSSTAAVYGIPADGVCREDTALAPINPYGTSKLMSEWMLRDVCAVNPMRHVTLRYFNVAGSDPDGVIGQSTPKATLLIKVACEVATGAREKLSIFGTDYPTRDGTGVRDFIHVTDLADAHIRALEYLERGGESTTLNCGYGRGYSVREVVDTVGRINGSAIAHSDEPRRPGDPPELIADPTRLRTLFDWQPSCDDLEEIVRTSLEWERKIARGEAYARR